MEPRNGIKALVGGFVFLGLLLFVGSIFLLGERGRYFSTQHRLRTFFTTVAGLHEGAAVRLAGVEVGRVTAIRLPDSPGQKVRVEFTVAGDAIANVRGNSTARLETMGFLGDKFVELSVGSPEAPPVADGATLVAADPIDLVALVGQGRRLLGNAEDLTAALTRGQGALPWLINDPDSKRLVQSLSRHLDEISGKLARGDGTLGALINDPTLYDDLALLLEGAERSRLIRWGIRHEIESGRKGRKERTG